MSCLMVDESMGDAFIDAVMPSFFSSIYLLADALYTISLSAILCPLGAVVGIFLYYMLVYRPAKKSFRKRKILLQTRKRNGDFGRAEKVLRQETYKELNRCPRGFAYGVSEFIRRLTVSLNDVIVTLITYLSDERLKKRVAVESAFVYKWRAMNKPALHQGTMLSNRGRDSISVTRFEDSATDGHYPVRKRKIAQNPPEIMRMVKASHMWWTVHDGQSNTISGSLVRQLLNSAQSASHSFRPDYSIARESQRELRATIFFDTGEALLRIWSSLLIAAAHEKVVDHDCNVELFEVPASALLKKLQNIFETFYPDGIPMSEVEKKEVCELFRKWVEGQGSPRSSGEMCADSQMVLFKAFHGWFYDLSEMIHNLMSDRLLTHVLLTKHGSNAASADAVKLLNTVAPKHSNIIYTSSYPARSAPVVVPSSNTMYTENPFFGSPLFSPYLHNPGDHNTIQDIKRHTDDDDLYSTYAQSSLEGRFPNSVNPMRGEDLSAI